MEDELVSKEEIKDALITMGWDETEDVDRLAPPDDLWENKPKDFYIYDAVDVQEILGKLFFEKLLVGTSNLKEG
jgi:hypothetical protein